VKLARLSHDPGALVEFFEESLNGLGALCERTWHDRLHVLAEGRSARLWDERGTFQEVELHFVAAGAAGLRDAAREVFPGCPLTFRLAAALRPEPLSLDRVVLRPTHGAHEPPEAGVAARLWHSQYPGSSGWRLETPFQTHWHFSLLALVRCEVQAIDQHWSIHRLAINLEDRQPDGALAETWEFAVVDAQPRTSITWPPVEPAVWQTCLRQALELDLAAQLSDVRARQERYLGRELERIEDYFDGYEAELRDRLARSGSESVKTKITQRVSAAAAERNRRRQDQVERHEIRVIPHWDALLLAAEPAWRAVVSAEQDHRRYPVESVFVPRLRRWLRPASEPGADHLEGS
jgi:hypothetical protein